MRLVQRADELRKPVAEIQVSAGYVISARAVTVVNEPLMCCCGTPVTPIDIEQAQLPVNDVTPTLVEPRLRELPSA